MRQNISEMHRISKDDAKTKLEHSTELQNIEKMCAIFVLFPKLENIEEKDMLCAVATDIRGWMNPISQQSIKAS